METDSCNAFVKGFDVGGTISVFHIVASLFLFSFLFKYLFPGNKHGHYGLMYSAGRANI